MRATLFLVLPLTVVMGATGTPRVAQQSVVDATDCSEPRPDPDETIHRRIESDLTQTLPRWAVKTVMHSRSRNGHWLELTRDRLRVEVAIRYLLTSDDAAELLACRLQAISVPKYNAVPDIGDEAYVLTASHLWFRAGTVVFDLFSADRSLETEKEIARRLIRPIQARPPE
jgi:hypothetical protein